MGQFTSRIRRKTQPHARQFTIPERFLSMGWNRPDRDREFVVRQLYGDEVDWTDDMVIRSIARVGGRKVSGRKARAWWRSIGPKARAGVRLCFHAVHSTRRDG